MAASCVAPANARLPTSPLLLLLLLLPLWLCLTAAASSIASSSSSSSSSIAPFLSSPQLSHLLSNDSLYIARSEFPASFKFGALTWAIKNEAASYDDGKSDGLWDVYARQKGTVFDGSTPAAGGDHYHRYPEDIELLSDLGMNSFRFSIAWPRMFPNGTGEVNALAVSHYNDVIDKLLDAGIEPFVTLYEQDLPQVLEDSYGGMLSPLFIDDYLHFANACFIAFGDRVKNWMTFDEGNDFIPYAYAGSFCPPGRCTVGVPQYDCPAGNSSTEPYIAGHNMLLAHAAAVELYRNVYQSTQGGEIGIGVWFRWFEPLTNSTEDKKASLRATDFTVGWFVEPILYGDYPLSMKEVVGSRLPTFTAEESARIRSSVDFIGLSCVTGIYATNDDERNVSVPGYFEDWGVKLTGYRDGVAIGRNDGEYFVPWSLGKAVSYMRTRYDNVKTYITALGYGVSNSSLDDDIRVQFYAEYLRSLSAGISAGADVQGVFAWSLMDGFEATLGKGLYFGLFYVDDANERYPRSTASWFKNMLKGNATTAFQS